MSNFVIPDELTFERVGQMYPSTKTEYRRQPSNNTRFTNGDIQMPMNKMMYSFMNPPTGVLNFNVKYSFTNPTAAAINNVRFGILGSAFSHFQRITLKSLNGGVIETLDRIDLLTNMILNMTTNIIDKSAMINMGFHSTNCYSNIGYNETIGNIASLATSTLVVNYSIPLVGAFNCNKLIDLTTSDMEIDYTVNNPSEYILVSDAGITVVPEIYDVELVYDVLTLEQQGYNELKNNYGGVFEIKTTSYKYGSSELQAGAGRGTYEIIMPHQVNSLKKFFWYCSPQDNAERNYGGVNPNLQDYALIVNSTSYPQQRVKVPKLAEAYYQVSKSFGAVNSASHSGSMNRQSFGKASRIVAGSSITQQYTVYNSTAITDPVSAPDASESNKFYQVIDLEKINQLKNSIYSGINSKGSTNTFILNVGETLSANIHKIHFWSEYDMVLTFDTMNQMVVVAE